MALKLPLPGEFGGVSFLESSRGAFPQLKVGLPLKRKEKGAVFLRRTSCLIQQAPTSLARPSCCRTRAQVLGWSEGEQGYNPVGIVRKHFIKSCMNTRAQLARVKGKAQPTNSPHPFPSLRSSPQLFHPCASHPRISSQTPIEGNMALSSFVQLRCKPIPWRWLHERTRHDRGAPRSPPRQEEPQGRRRRARRPEAAHEHAAGGVVPLPRHPPGLALLRLVGRGGVPWREILREDARRGFEEARFELDPEIVTRLLIGGGDAVQKALHRLVEASKQRVEAGEQQRRDGGR